MRWTELEKREEKTYEIYREWRIDCDDMKNMHIRARVKKNCGTIWNSFLFILFRNIL